MKSKGGFTLVELLVVISIISVLSSVVLVSLNSARTRGINTRIQQSIIQIRNELELGRSNDTYPDLPQSTGTGASAVPVTYELFTNQKIKNIMATILSDNAGMYAGGIYGGPGVNPSNCIEYLYGVNYYGGSDTANYYKDNGLTIYVSPAGCAAKRNYAIYAEKAPIRKTSLSSIQPTDYAGYYCVDSSGTSITTDSGWIPGSIVDGKCH